MPCLSEGILPDTRTPVLFCHRDILLLPAYTLAYFVFLKFAIKKRFYQSLLSH